MFLWDVEQGITTRRWSGHNNRIEAVQFAGEGDSVVVTGVYLCSRSSTTANDFQAAQTRQLIYGIRAHLVTSLSRHSLKQAIPFPRSMFMPRHTRLLAVAMMATRAFMISVRARRLSMSLRTRLRVYAVPMMGMRYWFLRWMGTSGCWIGGMGSC